MTRFRLSAPVPGEDELHETVVRALTFLLMSPAVFACYPAGHIRLPPRDAAKLARMGLRRGMPDLLFFYQARTYGIELKPEGGRLSRTYLARTARGALVERLGQEEMFPRLERAGMAIGVCHSVAEVLQQLRTWGLPVRASA